MNASSLGRVISSANADSARLGDQSNPLSPEVSVIMPCLNEAKTVGVCIEKIQKTFRREGIEGEVVVADNGSSDGSQDIALEPGRPLREW